MILRRICILVAALLLGVTAGTAALTPQEELGRNLFFDESLSTPEGQACAACHAPEVGYTGPDSTINALGAVYQGAVNGRFGNRKPPSAAYAGDSPILTHTAPFTGGMFWDGRATGWTLGDPLAEQAQGPFLNPLEQNNPDATAVITKVKAGSYSGLFNSVCGSADDKYECIARAIAAYERSSEVNAFTSKYDYWRNNTESLTEEEMLGWELFNGKAMCANCHVPTLFTDFTYDNLGIPRNPLNPFYYEPEWNPMGLAWVDNGLGEFLMKSGYSSGVYKKEMGKFKVPTLRNVDLRPSSDFIKAYGHNGYFKSLKQIVHFYNTRDAMPTCNQRLKNDVPGVNCWPSPEVSKNINKAELGNLGLTEAEEDAIVAFLKTLSDGYAH